MTSKYDPLTAFLSATPAGSDDVILCLQRIIQILGFPLPESAFRYRQWWENQRDTSGRPQARAWSAAGFRVEEVKLSRIDGWVRFVGVGGLRSGRFSSQPPAGSQRKRTARRRNPISPQRHQAGKPFVKKSYYRELAARFGRTAKAFEYRAQNISHVLSLQGGG